MRWKIKFGNSVNIVEQPWLLDDSNPFITSRVQGLKNIQGDMFNVRDQQCIRSVPLNENIKKILCIGEKKCLNSFSSQCIQNFARAKTYMEASGSE